MSNARILIAEAIGTMILMLGGPGVAVLAAGTGALDGAAVLAVSFGFGFALLIAAYSIGHVSGCHINPAVTIGMWIMKKIDGAKVPAYILGQVIGAVVGGLIIWVIRRGAADSFDANPANFATNLWDDGNGFFGFWPMVVAEIVLTAVLMFAVLSTTRKGYNGATVGLHVGLTLTLIHLISIPVDNTSVNPVRSFGMAIFAGGDAMEQLWAFIVFPIIGAIVGALLWLLLDDADLEDTALAGTGVGSALIGARDAAGGVTDRVGFLSDGAGNAGVGGDVSDQAPSIQGFVSMPETDAAGTGGATEIDSSMHPYGVGSHAVLDDGSMPDGYPVKGNDDSMLYHRPDSRNYGATGAEVWFDTSRSAESSGFSLSPTHSSPADPMFHPYGVGSHAVLDDGSMPDGYPIKGNDDSMLYHRTDSRNYGATVAEVWFDTPERAEASGFALAATHPG